MKGKERFTKCGLLGQELLLQPLFKYLWSSLLFSLKELLWSLCREVVLSGKVGMGGGEQVGPQDTDDDGASLSLA